MEKQELFKAILRGIQSLSALIAMSCAAAGFPKRVLATGHDVQLGSSEFTFLILTSFLAWLLTMAWGIGVYALKQPEPLPVVALVMDGIFTLFFFSAGIATAVSDYVTECENYVDGLRCSNLTAAVVFAFIAFLAFLTTLVQNMLTSGLLPKREEHPYHESTTPGADLPTKMSFEEVAPAEPSPANSMTL